MRGGPSSFGLSDYAADLQVAANGREMRQLKTGTMRVCSSEGITLQTQASQIVACALYRYLEVHTDMFPHVKSLFINTYSTSERIQ